MRKIIQKVLTIVLTAALVCCTMCALPFISSAADSGVCGDSLTWTFTNDGTLTISGTGEMYDYDWCEHLLGEGHYNEIKHVKINDGVTSIGEWAFSTYDIISVVIPDSVTVIEHGAFYACNDLSQITIPKSVTSIGGWAFSECSALKDIQVDENNQNYTSIDGVLYNKDKTELISCPAGKTELEIPSGVTAIGEGAFQGCMLLSDIEIPSGVTTIADNAFYRCSSLKALTIPDGVTSIGGQLLSGTAYFNEPNNWTGDLLYVNKHLIAAKSSLCGDYSLLSDTKSIASDAFNYCRSLKSVNIPDSIENIVKESFSYCSTLESIQVSENNQNYTTVGGVLYNKDKTKLICCPAGKSSVEILEGTTDIERGAFGDCGAITSVVIPDSVASIGDFAFYNCTKLMSVIIPDSVTSIGKNAFNSYSMVKLYGCENSYAQKYAEENFVTFVRAVKIADKYISDVKSTAWYYDFVEYALSNKLFNGTSETTFAPDVVMTRGMVVQVLYNLEGKPTLEKNSTEFDDVNADDWFADAVIWAETNGVVNGMTATAFEPNGNVTREQMTTILHRYANLKKYDVSASTALTKFPDGDKLSSYAEDSLKWAVGAGLISGNKRGDEVLLDARGNATRAQVAKILCSFCENVVK